MHRIVHHQSYIRRGYLEVCDALDADTERLLREATGVAAAFAASMAPHLSALSESFDVDEDVAVESGPLQRHRSAATLDITWVADPAKRLLPSVTATLEVNSIVPDGSAAATELVLHGEYEPPRGSHGGAAEFFLQRRVVDGALHMFLRRLVETIEHAMPEPTRAAP